MPAAALTAPQLHSLRTQLLTWFATYKRDLPWRQNRDPYRIWISEIMLQQTRVAAVIPYFEKFCARFPDARSLAQAEEAEVLRLWSGLGYYSRARNLQAAAKQIVSEHAGVFPSTETGIRALRGIGQYTTNAFLSIAFDQTHAVLDGNVARVVARLEAVCGELRESQRWQALQKSADRLLAHESPGNWNQAMMELGATICTPHSPQCLLCPVTNFCRARQLGIQNEIPEKRKKRAIVEVVLAAAILTDKKGQCLLLPPPKKLESEKSYQAPAADHIPTLVSKMWHFPTIAIAKNPEKELRSYLNNLLPATNHLPPRFVPLKKVRHAVTYRSISVLPFFIECAKLPDHRGAKKISLQDLSSVPISNLTRKIAKSAQSK
jgi:A/G-specific adenine glycosylase